jgi:chemotaxis protein methyltransferase CheR
MEMAVMKEMRRTEFEGYARIVYEHSGIKLEHHKRDLLQSRLRKRLRALAFDSFKGYFQYLVSDETGLELGQMLDCVTTNKTEFFRESRHFEQFMGTVLPGLKRAHKDPVRIWSAACSTGEEAYGLAMCAVEVLEKVRPVKVLGTDLSHRVLAKALEGRYEREIAENIPSGWLSKYFHLEKNGKESFFQVSPELRELTQFSRLNLNGTEYPFSSRFDVIFCRNVMIYFDQPVQQILVERLTRVLKHGGYLYTGFSESLLRVRHGLKSVAPSVYLKP